MNLKERLALTNPEDFVPIERYVEIAAALSKHGVYAHVKEMSHGEKGDFIYLRLHTRGNVNSPSSLILSFEKNKLIVLGPDSPQGENYLEILALCLDLEVNDENREVYNFNKTDRGYRVTFDLK